MVAPGLKGGPPVVGLITLGLNILCPSWFAVYLSPLICVLDHEVKKKKEGPSPNIPVKVPV